MNMIGDNEIINVSNTQYDSDSNSSSSTFLSSTDDEIVVLKNKIIINYTNKIDNNNNNYLNDKKNECLICFDKLKKNIIIIQNNYCKCFFFSLLCEKCFFRWFIDNNKCFICRNSFCPDKNDIFRLFDFYNAILLFKLRNIINNRENKDKFKLNLPIRQQIHPQAPQNVSRIPINLLSHSNNSTQSNRSSVIETIAVEISNESAVELPNETAVEALNDNNPRILPLSDYCKFKIKEIFICLSILTFGGFMFYMIYMTI